MALKLSEDVILEWRVDQFLDLGFRMSEARTLAASRGDNGYPLDLHLVKRCLKQGCTHIQAYRIFKSDG